MPSIWERRERWSNENILGLEYLFSQTHLMLVAFWNLYTILSNVACYTHNCAQNSQNVCCLCDFSHSIRPDGVLTWPHTVPHSSYRMLVEERIEMMNGTMTSLLHLQLFYLNHSLRIPFLTSHISMVIECSIVLSSPFLLLIFHWLMML